MRYARLRAEVHSGYLPSNPSQTLLRKETQMTTHWDIDVSHSAIHFHVRHMVISKVHGRFAAMVGRHPARRAGPDPLLVDVRVDTASIDTQVADRDAHLKSADFLDVAKYPQMTFRSARSRRPARATVSRAPRPATA